MNTKTMLMLCTALAAAAAFAQGAEKATVESTPEARMSARTKDKTRDPGLFGDYWWANRFLSRHREIENLKGKPVDVVMIGDSIVHFWEKYHKASWDRFVANRTVLNLGYGGDHTETVLWRIDHGELDGYEAKVVVLMIGTNNNAGRNTKPENVAEAIELIIARIREHQPKATIVLHPIFPRGSAAQPERHAGARSRNEKTNELLKKFVEKDGKVVWIDFNDKLVDETGWVPKSIMTDALHPTAAGYDIWAEALAPVIGK
jgi:beta-glucosidase